MKKVSVDGLLALKPEQIKIVYLRCMGNTVEKTAKRLHLGSSTVYKILKDDINTMLGVDGWGDIKADLCHPLRKMVSSVEELENWPEGFREKIEALRDSLEPQKETQSSTGIDKSRLPPWILVAIPIFILCVFGFFGLFVGLRFLQGLPFFLQDTQTPEIPTNTSTARPTITQSVVITQTSLPTLTHTPPPPTPTSPSPTFTSTPTETSTPRPPALFETSFDSGMPDGMEMVYGDIDLVDGELLAHELTLLSIGEDTWKNYQVEYETRKHTYCWGIKNNGIAAHATDPENMIVWSWNYCETGWFEMVSGDWVKITGGRDIVANPGTVVKIRLVAENGNFTVYTNNIKRTSYYDEKYTQGKVYIVINNTSVIDNIYISLLP